MAFFHAALPKGHNDPWCGFQTLRVFHQADVVPPPTFPLIIAALQSTDQTNAELAVIFLSAHGGEREKAALLKYLNSLREREQPRAQQIRSKWKDDPSLGRIAYWEAQLASALLNAKGWKLTAAEKESLMGGCLSKLCDETAEGRPLSTF